MTQKHIVVIGAGAWGTALSVAMRRVGHRVSLLTRCHEHAKTVHEGRENKRYLAGIPLDPGILVEANPDHLKDADVILWVVPAQFAIETADSLLPYIQPHCPIVICSKGIDAKSPIVDENSLLTAVIGKILPNPLAILSGPNFAIEVAHGLPAAATLAAFSPDLAIQLVQTLKHPRFRLYASDDPIGVQVAGAVKNVIAIASGIVFGKNLGHNANAALMTRGLAEIRRLGLSLGGKLQTFLGLAAVGDLTLTCSSQQSRNMSLGVALGQGQKLEDILKSRHTVAEGLYTAAAVHKLSALKSVPMPICEAVHNILYHQGSVDEVIESLLDRREKWEDL